MANAKSMTSFHVMTKCGITVLNFIQTNAILDSLLVRTNKSIQADNNTSIKWEIGSAMSSELIKSAVPRSARSSDPAIVSEFSSSEFEALNAMFTSALKHRNLGDLGPDERFAGKVSANVLTGQKTLM